MLTVVDSGTDPSDARNAVKSFIMSPVGVYTLECAQTSGSYSPQTQQSVIYIRQTVTFTSSKSLNVFVS